MNAIDLKDMTNDELCGAVRFYDGFILKIAAERSQTDYLEMRRQRDVYAAELKQRTATKKTLGSIELVICSDGSFERVIVGVANEQ